ncbi:MAG: hypothetical protein KDB35_23730 [Acidimicrobiales bacterium]|nr:hypothetical protein [Acidimicrobiales bacterium]
MRVSAAGVGHRATIDIDLVTVDAEPEAAEVLADAHHADPQPLIIDEVKVDLIATSPVTDDELDGLEDKDRLFVAGHRWAFEGAEPSRLTVQGAEPVAVKVATPAGLVASKSHAVGYPTSRRRATKSASDLLDLFRLVDLYDRDGGLNDELRRAPGGIGRIIADVAQDQILTNPAAATSKMNSASPAPIEVGDVEAVIETFVDGLRTS